MIRKRKSLFAGAWLVAVLFSFGCNSAGGVQDPDPSQNPKPTPAPVPNPNPEPVPEPIPPPKLLERFSYEAQKFQSNLWVNLFDDHSYQVENYPEQVEVAVDRIVAKNLSMVDFDLLSDSKCEEAARVVSTIEEYRKNGRGLPITFKIIRDYVQIAYDVDAYPFFEDQPEFRAKLQSKANEVGFGALSIELKNPLRLREATFKVEAEKGALVDRMGDLGNLMEEANENLRLAQFPSGKLSLSFKALDLACDLYAGRAKAWVELRAEEVTGDEEPAPLVIRSGLDLKGARVTR